MAGWPFYRAMQLPPNSPPWLQIGWKEIGVHEQPENRGPAIRRYIQIGKCGQEGDPWCAIFENFMLESCGIPGTRSASSQSFRADPSFVKLTGPALGAIAVFWRGSRQSGLGHVGNYLGERSGFIWTLGGNEGDMVQVEALPQTAPSFGLVGYYWPKSVPVPQTGPIAIAANVPSHMVSVT